MRSLFLFLARRVAVAVLLAAGLAGAGQPVARAQADDADIRSLDRVIAVVNNEVITAGELQTAVALVRERAGGSPLPPPDELEDGVLESLVMERAQAQAARSRGIFVDDRQVDRAIDNIARENKVSIAQMRARLQSEGVSFDEFRGDIRNQIIEGRLRESVVDAQIRISDADIDAWLAEQAGKSVQSMQLEVAQILLPVPEDAPDDVVEERRTVAAELADRASMGEDFAELAARYSATPDAAENGGSLGWRTLEQLPSLFVNAIRDLEAGQVAPLVRSPAGWHVLKLLGRRGGPGELDKPVTQTRVRHILIRPGTGLGEDEIRRRLNSIRERLEAGAVTFDAMARQYSVDGSAANGGELGWVYAGDTVPEFERAMDALAPGQISEPIRTQFGFHLIQVLERRQDTASAERQRQAARRALTEQRSEATWREWLDELRARTYVEKRFER